jgi:hypothetical protein
MLDPRTVGVFRVDNRQLFTCSAGWKETKSFRPRRQDGVGEPLAFDDLAGDIIPSLY